MIGKYYDFFCALPFEHFEVNVHGDVYVCCPARLRKVIGNLKEQSIAEIWNSSAIQDIRSSILDGSYKYCNYQKCGVLQKAKAHSILGVF